MCVCACMYIHIHVCVALSGSLEWVLCCLDVASVVSSLSRCCVLSGAPCFMSKSCEFGECHCLFAMYVLLSGGLCVCVCVCVCEVSTCV